MSTPRHPESEPRDGSARAPVTAALVAVAALAGFVLVGTAGPARAGTWGTPLGKKSVRTAIASPGDVDAFLVEAHAGGRLEVRVATKKGSALLPDVVLVGPDGAPSDAAFESSGRSLRLRRFDVPSTGRYEIRVSGRDGSTGDYTVSAKVAGSPDVGVKGLSVGARQEQAFAFAAGGGARLDFAVRSKPSALTFARIESPNGVYVPVPSGAIRTNAGGLLKGKAITLPETGAFGTWRLVLRADAGALSGVRARLSARGGRLDTVRGTLAADEPRLTSVAPLEAGPGTELLLAGSGFADDKKRALRVFVGGVEAGDVVLSGATAVRAKVPAGVLGTSDVAILNGDGHAAALRDAVLVVPPPRVTSFSPVQGPAAGGTTVTVRGSGFRAGTAVTVAGTAFGELTQVVSDTELLFTTPEFAGGPQDIGVRDRTGQESFASATYDFVRAPFVLDIEPPIVPRLSGESVLLRGGAFTAEQTVTVGGVAPLSITLPTTGQMRLTLPALDVGVHDVVVRDPLDQTSTTPGGIASFTFAAGPELDTTGGPAPSDMALCDYDDDGDLDVFLIASGGGSLSSTSQLRVLRNDRDAYVDVTDSVLPEPDGDDWRGETIAFGDVAADVGALPPDGWPDLVIGTLDSSLLGATRSRIRILANRAGAGGERVFVDRTDVVMAPTSPYDDWRAEDLWIGDLDGDGGVPDIVATHDENPEGVSPLSPYYVYYLSGTRVFSFATPQSGGYGAFAWQSRRMPHVIGTQVPTQGFPNCVGGQCRGTFPPFRGRSLAVTDLDGDGRRDIAVTSPGDVTVNGSSITSTQIGANKLVSMQDLVLDRTSVFSFPIAPLKGDIVLAGSLIGDEREDLVVVRNPGTGSTTGLAVDILQNRGLDTTWSVRSNQLLPAAAGDERLQADAARLADVDGDGDLDLVLLVISPPTTGSSATGRGLRILRNNGEAGFSRVLEDLLPDGPDALNGTALAVGDLVPDQPGIVVAKPDAQGDGTEVRTILRTILGTTAE